MVNGYLISLCEGQEYTMCMAVYLSKHKGYSLIGYAEVRNAQYICYQSDTDKYSFVYYQIKGNRVCNIIWNDLNKVGVKKWKHVEEVVL